LQTKSQKNRFLGQNLRPKNRRSEEHTSELQSLAYLVCRLLLEKKKVKRRKHRHRKHVSAGSVSALRWWASLSTFSSRKETSAERPGNFFLKYTNAAEIYVLSLRDALPI